MSFSFDTLLGIHPAALALRARRSELLATNLAHADTPDFKARDVDFKTVLARTATASRTLLSTHERHLDAGPAAVGAEPAYRIPLHPSVDGNTVVTHVEQAEFADNAVRYQASLMFINRKLSGIRAALSDQ